MDEASADVVGEREKKREEEMRGRKEAGEGDDVL
jgi:hypothetical protein